MQGNLPLAAARLARAAARRTRASADPRRVQPVAGGGSRRVCRSEPHDPRLRASVRFHARCLAQGPAIAFKTGADHRAKLSAVRIRKSQGADLPAMFAIINDAAQAYRGVIPADRWHEPYMPMDELVKEIAAGIVFWIAEEDGRPLGVMGMQDKGEVALVRHAYVTTGIQRKGVGTTLLRHVQGLTAKPVLIGTWAAASWAIAFYRRNGFTVVSHGEKERLLRTYWSIPERQVETSVVLADRRWTEQQQQQQ